MAERKPAAKKRGAAPAAKKEPSRRPDWEAIERDYRTGRFTLRELETKHGAQNSTIARRAAKGGWTKDLAEAVRQATNAKLIEQTVQQECSSAQQNAATVVLAAAELNKEVILRHRGDIAATRGLAMEMLGEIRAATQSPEDLQALLRIAKEGADDVTALQVQQAFNDMVKVHNRVGSVHKLADTLTKLQTLERRAFGMTEDADDDERNKRRGSIPIEFVDANVTDG